VAFAAKNLNPAVIIDIATLTGAQGIATGRHFAALYCNDEELESLAVSSGRIVGEMAHPLPYAPEFFQREFASAVADMKNSVKDRANAQSSCAGQFIGSHMPAFVEEGRWLHIDMAYPSFTGERATGFGAALLTQIVEAMPVIE
jgi:probable aminopeptidase NPEPL1